ncbi:MAG: hypothetical protein GY835_21950 [bacterium]|nr:hypothetical protein [bacterium]
MIQVVLGMLLFGTLITLCFKAIQLVRVHFLTKYGTQAWALPAAIGLISLFFLFTLYRSVVALTACVREMRESADAFDNKEDS